MKETRVPFKEIISSNTQLLFDGAVGTELYNHGIFINRCFEEANLSNPAIVEELHKAYISAGAQVITTNSWGANRTKLKGHNLQEKVSEINLAAAKLARKAAGDKYWVAGSVGPLGVRIEPLGPTSLEKAQEMFSEQIAALLQGGVDLIALETFSDISEIQQAIEACRKINPEIPIIAMIVINPDGKTIYGTPVEWAMKKLDEWQVSVVGLNCSVGPQPMMSSIEKIRSVTKLPICLEPNAGLPKEIDGRQIYMSTPEYMAHFAKDFLQAGIQFVGGCCGTSPEHIKAMANMIRQASAMSKSTSRTSIHRLKNENMDIYEHRNKEKEAPVERVSEQKKSLWAAKIANGERVYSVELLPPSGVSTSKIIQQSKELKIAGIHAINIPDGPRASARMSAILTAVMIEQSAGIETVLHYCCRDRNLLGMQSDMLGAHAVGLRNVLLITGDPPKLGNYPDATGVFDVDSIGLTNMVHSLNGGIDLGNRSIGEPTALSIGVGVNPGHRDFAYEMNRFKWKVKAGAAWAITQPVFDVDAVRKFLDHIDKNNIHIPIIAGVWPLLSYRNALFMNNEVPGIIIPAKIMERIAKTQSPQDARKLGVEIAREMIEKLGNDIQGIQLSAPFGRIDLSLAIIGKSEISN
ncbi:MAG: bifunctional homocysteine S-methyltransferase/methylenetetrahydrofolate reductase [Bdellovibrionota bacterium]